MKNLEVLIQMLYKRVSIQKVIDNKIRYDSYDKAAFLNMVLSYVSYYSENEALNLLEHYIFMFQEDARKEGRIISTDLNVFEALFYCTGQVLVMRNNEILCHFPKLIEWRKLVLELSEDTLVAAFLTRKLPHSEVMNRGFLWKRVIGHDNMQLNAIIDRGISENHFHLGGSAPIFHISWISLMNNVNIHKFGKVFRAYDRDRRYKNIAYESDYQEISFYQRYLQAVLIRILIYSKLSGRHFKIGGYYVEMPHIKKYFDVSGICVKTDEKHIVFTYDMEKELQEYFEERLSFCTFEEVMLQISYLMYPENEALEFWEQNAACYKIIKEKIGKYKLSVFQVKNCLKKCTGLNFFEIFRLMLNVISKVDLEDVQDLFKDMGIYYRIWDTRTLDNIKYLLSYPKYIEYQVENIQSIIDSYRISVGKFSSKERFLDYALQDLVYNGLAEEKKISFLFSGERWLMYMMFKSIYWNDMQYKEYYNLFYAYLLIKESIRSELVQSNQNVGFRNFQKYQNRKDDLLSDQIYQNMFVRAAVSENLISKHIKKLEIRLSPSSSISQNCKMILRTDALLDPENALRDRFFYTLHFIKAADKLDEKTNFYFCRHYQKRKDIEKKALAIVGVREKYPIIGERILGIDAASNEIGCRPEVFAVMFRYLKEHRSIYYTIDGKKSVPQLNITYHVGEDFLDLADGLRAIEEAILFLRLESGSRLGHALALGVNVMKWYASKDFRIALPVQDYLDNLVWIYYKLIQFNIKGYENLKEWIVDEFTILFDEIYISNVTEEEMERISFRSGKKDFTRVSKPSSNIYNYYHAWELRGDDPKLYEFGFFDEAKYLQRLQTYRVNLEYPKSYKLRHSSEIATIFYLYHFNEKVRVMGAKTKEVHVSKSYVKAVEAIQKALQMKIAEGGIAIETNPTSNYLIGTFRRYEEHPIISFYNKGLVKAPEKLAECPQISVSINTDDQGVFNTSLENEYALMACALESVTDANDEHIYNRSNIYEWLDQIRVMGNEQSFGHRERCQMKKEG